MIWAESQNCGCLVTWFCYQLIANPGNKTAIVPWPDPYWYAVIKNHKRPFQNTELIICINKQRYQLNAVILSDDAISSKLIDNSNLHVWMPSMITHWRYCSLALNHQYDDLSVFATNMWKMMHIGSTWGWQWEDDLHAQGSFCIFAHPMRDDVIMWRRLSLAGHIYKIIPDTAFPYQCPMYANSEWEMTSQCNVVSHWLDAYTKWSLMQPFCTTALCMQMLLSYLKERALVSTGVPGRSTGSLQHEKAIRNQNGCHFADNVFKGIFLNENIWISIKISLKLAPRVQSTIFQHWFRQWLGANHRDANMQFSKCLMILRHRAKSA